MILDAGNRTHAGNTRYTGVIKISQKLNSPRLAWVPLGVMVSGALFVESWVPLPQSRYYRCRREPPAASIPNWFTDFSTSSSTPYHPEFRGWALLRTATKPRRQSRQIRMFHPREPMPLPSQITDCAARFRLWKSKVYNSNPSPFSDAHCTLLYFYPAWSFHCVGIRFFFFFSFGCDVSYVSRNVSCLVHFNMHCEFRLLPAFDLELRESRLAFGVHGVPYVVLRPVQVPEVRALPDHLSIGTNRL